MRTGGMKPQKKKVIFSPQSYENSIISSYFNLPHHHTRSTHIYLPSLHTFTFIALHQTEDYMATLTYLPIVNYEAASAGISFWCVISLRPRVHYTTSVTWWIRWDTESTVCITPCIAMKGGSSCCPCSWNVILHWEIEVSHQTGIL